MKGLVRVHVPADDAWTRAYKKDPGLDWRRTVVDARIELADDLTPTLRRELETDLADLYDAAREQAAEALAEYGEAVRLPAQCPWMLDEVLRRGWFPEGVGS